MTNLPNYEMFVRINYGETSGSEPAVSAAARARQEEGDAEKAKGKATRCTLACCPAC